MSWSGIVIAWTVMVNRTYAGLRYRRDKFHENIDHDNIALLQGLSFFAWKISVRIGIFYP